MEPKTGEPMEAADERDDDDGDSQHEHVISGPTGYRIVSETTAEDLLNKLAPGDRIHVVVIRDPEVGKLVGTVTVVRADHLDRLDEVCKETEDPWHVAIRRAAYTQVCFQLWGGMPPDGTELEHVFEISQRELLEIMESEMSLRASRAEDAS